MEKIKLKQEKRRPKGEGETDDSEFSQNREDDGDRRLSSRVKKPKLMYDPSDLTAPYKKVSIEELTKSPKKISEMPERKVSVYKGTINFEDKSCKVCKKMLDGVPSVVCIMCKDGYHCYCHQPRVGKTTRKSTWACRDCRESTTIPIHSTSKPASVAPTSQTPTSGETSRRSSINKSEMQSEEEFGGFEEEKKSNGNSNGTAAGPDTGHLEDGYLKINLAKAKALLSITHMPNMDSVPDCSSWECNEVYNYFVKVFPKEAHIFKEQEIDGTSLMLMTRQDMLKFNLKLGPALNIYRHIVMLQSRSLDPRKTWM